MRPPPRRRPDFTFTHTAQRVLCAVSLVLAAGAMASLIALSATVVGVKLRGRSVYGWQTDSHFDASKWLFQPSHYEEMRVDENRTPLYYAAIRRRLAGTSDTVVLDLGTGAQALLALEAARAGAARVYAIEAGAASAQSAREAIEAAGFSDVVTVVEGLSTEVTLPERVDVVVSEIVGDVASEEGFYHAIADAHRRFVKEPTLARSWIPHTCQTWGAPCSYALHSALADGHDAVTSWLDHDIGTDGPPRPSTTDQTVQLLAAPQLLENVRFTHAADLLGAGAHALGDAAFEITGDAIDTNAERYRSQLARAGAAAADAAAFGREVAPLLSGIALWPRLLLDDDAVVSARGEGGEHFSSHWRTVVSLLSLKPVAVAAGDRVAAALSAELDEAIEAAPRYQMEVSVEAGPLEAGDGMAPEAWAEMLDRVGGALRVLAEEAS